MNLTCVIRAEPRFYLQMSLSLAQLLQALSAKHYDITCRGAGYPGGFIHGWVTHLTPIDEKDSDGGEVMATFRQLDTVLSIIESPPPMEVEKAMLLKDFKQLLHSSLQISNKQLRQFEYTVGELERPQRLAILKNRNPIDDGSTYASVEDMLDAHHIPKYDIVEIKEPPREK